MILILVILSIIVFICFKKRKLRKSFTKKKLFTQGLIFNNENIIESGGLYGKSKLVEYSINKSDQIGRELVLPLNIFAEGIVLFKEKILLLTWKENDAYLINYNTFKIIKIIKGFNNNFDRNEGWGATYNYDNNELIFSDGSKKLYIFDPENLIKKREIVTNKFWLNELEYANGYVYANIWQTSYILKIDPKNGNIQNTYNLKIAWNHRFQGVLNGIAYDKKKNFFYITGKNWNKIYILKNF